MADREKASPETDALLRRALGGVNAPPGLRERILGSLDEEDSRRSASTGRGVLTFIRHPGVIVALAASLVLAFVLFPLTGRILGPDPAGLDRVDRVHLQGVVVCYDCDLQNVRMDGQVACREHGHANGLRTTDGALWRFTLGHAGQEALLSPAMRGRRMEVQGNLFRAIGYLDVSDYSSI